MGILGFEFARAASGTMIDAASPTHEATQPSFIERAVSHVSKLGM